MKWLLHVEHIGDTSPPMDSADGKRIIAIAKDILEISHDSSSGVETVVVPQSLCSAALPTDLYLWDRPDGIQGIGITGHAIHECYVSVRDIQRLARSVSAVFDDTQFVRHT